MKSLNLIKTKLDKATYSVEKMKKKKDYNNFVSKKELQIINNENNLVTKNNELIQKGCFNFTEQQLKCLNYIISKIKNKEELKKGEFQEYSIKELCEVMKIQHDTNNYELLKDSILNINKQSKWIKLDDKGNETIFTFFLECYANKNNDNMRISFKNEFLQLIHNYKSHFTSYELNYCLALKSRYAIRLYELLKSKKNYNEIYIYPNEIKKLWCIPDTYTNGNIKQRVLNVAIEQINEYTDLDVELLKPKKNGKNIEYFIIKCEEKQSGIISIYKENEKNRKKYIESKK